MIAGLTFCEARVSEPPHYLHDHRCSRKAKRVVGGKAYCEQHAKKADRRYPKGYKLP